MEVGKEVVATVLRSYSCQRSEKFAYWLQDRLATSRYGRVIIDPNDEGLAPNNELWYDEFRNRVARGQYMIALLGPELNQIDESDHFPGVALASEILYFWRQKQDDPNFPFELLIPVCIDCSLEDLARPAGEYEALQDVVVPFISTLRPFSVSTESFYGNLRQNFELSDAVALRMGIQPQAHDAQSVATEAIAESLKDE